MPNDPYIGHTAPLTPKRCILYIYSTNTGTEYFKHALYSPFFPSKCSLFHNANLFGSCIIHILHTGCAKIKKKIIQAPKGKEVPPVLYYPRCIFVFAVGPCAEPHSLTSISQMVSLISMCDKYFIHLIFFYLITIKKFDE